MEKLIDCFASWWPIVQVGVSITAMFLLYNAWLVAWRGIAVLLRGYPPPEPPAPPDPPLPPEAAVMREFRIGATEIVKQLTVPSSGEVDRVLSAYANAARTVGVNVPQQAVNGAKEKTHVRS